MSESEYPAGPLRTRSGRKAIVPLWVLEADVLTDGEFKVYTALVAHADQEGGCFPKARRLSEITHKAVGTCRNAVQKFRRLGMIETEAQYREDGSQTSNLYAIAEVPPPEIAAKVEQYRAELKARRNQTPLHHTVQGGSTTQWRGPTPHDVANNNPREQPKRTTPPSPAPDPPPPPPVPVQNRGGNDSKITDQDPDPVQVLIGELGRLAPRWRDLERRVRAVLADPAVAGRPPEVVRAALVELAEGKHGPTASPRRVLEDGPWWESASQRVVVAVPSPRLAAVRACGRCDPAGWALDDDGPARRCDHAVLVGAS